MREFVIEVLMVSTDYKSERVEEKGGHSSIGYGIITRVEGLQFFYLLRLS